MSGPILLVTNDDGVYAPGLKALAAALGRLGTVYVVAPDREISVTSGALQSTGCDVCCPPTVRRVARRKG